MRLALLISGGGTTMEAIIKACNDDTLPKVEPVLVIASKAGIGGIERALKAGLWEDDILVINPKDFESKEAFGKAIIEECKKREVDFVGQYGWLVMTPLNVINEYEGRIVNQHPGPLDGGRPDFGGKGMYGLRVHAARLEFAKVLNKDFWTEMTAHRVTKEFDKGAILKREVVEILKDDTPESLQKRALPIEHRVQIELLKDFSMGKVKEFQRDTELVLNADMKILAECKRRAIEAYPNG